MLTLFVTFAVIFDGAFGFFLILSQSSQREQSNWTPVIALAVLSLLRPFPLKLRALIGEETKSETQLSINTNKRKNVRVRVRTNEKREKVFSSGKTFEDHKISQSKSNMKKKEKIWNQNHPKKPTISITRFFSILMAMIFVFF